MCSSEPRPPFLVVRWGLAFWGETRPPTDCRATLQAFRDGCYHDANCFDAGGGEWTVADAKLGRTPSLRCRALPWTRLPVALTLGPRRHA